MEEYEVKYQFNSPVPEDCSTDLVPNGALSKNGKRVIEVPILTSMTKYLFDKDLGNQRLPMYTFLNRLLRNGSLSRIVGCRVMNKVINRQACEFPDVTYWKISREEFYADVRVHLTLDTPTGTCDWSGVLICSCEFSIDGFFCEIEELTSYVDRESQGLIMLSPFLIPYYKNKMVDEEAEEMWVRHRMEEALTDPSKRDPQELARHMGLNVVFLPVYEHQNVDGIVFFDDSKLVVGEDYVKKDEQGRKIHHKSDSPQTIEIQADTIVINSNRVQEKYAAFPIFHECFHYDNHFCYAMLQKFASSDRRIVKKEKKEVPEDEEPRDPIYFMEKQANRGALALMLPVSDTSVMIEEEIGRIKRYANTGELYDDAGRSRSRSLELPEFRIKARMIQLGHIEAAGAMNYVDRRRIQPFAFDAQSWRAAEHTFVVTPEDVRSICKSNNEFDQLIKSEQYVYGDGHVVLNEPKYVKMFLGEMRLTSWALAHVDQCCLRFSRRYVQKGVGNYVPGRLFFDQNYVKQSLLYLDPIMKKRKVNEVEAKMIYKAEFPVFFIDAFDEVMKINGDTRESISEKLNITSRQLYNILNDPEKKVTRDFIVFCALIWKLPDWIAFLLLERAGMVLRQSDRRHQALEYCICVNWDLGVDEANKLLRSMRVPELKFPKKDKDAETEQELNK